MSGSVFKRCKCRDANGRELGTRCPELRRPDGSYSPNHGSWYARCELEPDEDGKRRTIRRGGFDSRRDALRWLDEVRGKASKGVDVTKRVTVATYLREWLDGKPDLAPSTRHSYEQHVGDYFVPAFGRLELGLLRPAHVEAMFAAIDAEREGTGARSMGPATKRRVRATLQSALSDAEREGLVMVNAARLARLASAPRPKVKPLEPAELGRLLDHLATDPMGVFFETVAATGLRRGEALGLRWDDVDLVKGTVTVRQQLTQRGGMHPCPYCTAGHRGMSWGKPKTDASERTIELDGHTVGLLLGHRLAQDVVRGEWGDAYSDHGLVFAREDGTPPYGDEATKRFAELCVEAGVRRVRLHDLRHGAASLRLAAGVDIAVVSKVLGHSGIAITNDTYSHLLEGVGRAAAEAANALVPRAPRGSAETAGLPSGSRS